MIVPRGSRLYIERIVESAEAKEGKVVLTDEDFKAPSSLKVKVLAVGSDVTDIKVDDVLMVSQFAPTEVKENPGDRNRYMIPEEDVLAIVASDEATE